MNSVISALLAVTTLIIAKKIILRARKKKIKDERTAFIGSKAAQATYVVFTTTLAITSFALIFFGEYGRVPTNYMSSLGTVLSYLTCFILILYIVFYSYFSRKS